MTRSRTARKGITGITAAALAVLGLTLGGCEPPQFGPEEPQGGDTTKTGTATLILMNQRETDPGELVFLLYAPGVQDIENVAPQVTLKPVEFEETQNVTVDAGKWKVAYRMESGDLRPMPPDEDEATDTEWPVVDLAKGKTYTILVETDEGGLTVWRHNLPVVD